MNIPVSQQYAIGIDIGGTNTYSILDHRGSILYRGAMSSRGHDTIEPYMEE